MNSRNLLFLAPLVFAASLLAQPAAPDAPGGGPRRGGPRGPGFRGMDPMMRVLDTNHDGILSPDEIAGSSIALRSLDVNDDGNVSIEEIRQATLPPAEGGPRRGMAGGRGGPFAATGPIGLELDANHDGVIQPMEIANAFSSLKLLDVNNDGVLTPDELRPLYQHRGQAGDAVAAHN